MADSSPYLSLVVASRNDDHGGNPLGRMQIFLRGWLEQARRHDLPSELIVVEWNPPADRPRLRDVLQWPDNFGPCEVRFIEVPPELHARYEHAEALPLYQMIAKNVGIRRARGQFILATNIDILLSDELVEWIASRSLKPDRMYRIDRHDAMSDVPPSVSFQEQLEYCRTHLLRINAREGTYPVTPEGEPVLAKMDIAASDSGVTFGRGWYPVEQYPDGELFRWIGTEAEMHLVLPFGVRTLCLDLEPGPGLGDRPLVLEIFDGSEKLSSSEVQGRSELRIHFSPVDHSRRKLRFEIRGGGEPVGQDPRALNCRVHSVTWERRPPGVPGTVTRTVRVSSWKRLVRAWRQVQALVNRLATGGPLVTVTIPVAKPVRRAAAFYVSRGGCTGLVQGAAGGFLQMLGLRVKRTARHELKPHALNASQVAHLHTNACGDFTLVAREQWFNLRGYPEFDQYSMNIDSVFCYAAHYAGAREELLREPMRIYHIEHGSGSGWTPEGQAALFSRLAAKGIPYVPWDEVMGWAMQMSRLHCPIIFNHEDWGLAQFDLNECSLGAARRERAIQ